jgi:hypothetical protein
MTKCKFYNECKNQQLLWYLYAGIARDAKKTNDYFGDYMRVLQEMPKKPTAILETICGYCNELRMSMIICALYAGITRNVKC